LGGREGPGTAEGFGEDGMGGVENEGAEARGHPHNFT
jgi:hypothetical protein